MDIEEVLTCCQNQNREWRSSCSTGSGWSFHSVHRTNPLQNNIQGSKAANYLFPKTPYELPVHSTVDKLFEGLQKNKTNNCHHHGRWIPTFATNLWPSTGYTFSMFLSKRLGRVFSSSGICRPVGFLGIWRPVGPLRLSSPWSDPGGLRTSVPDGFMGSLNSSPLHIFTLNCVVWVIFTSHSSPQSGMFEHYNLPWLCFCRTLGSAGTTQKWPGPEISISILWKWVWTWSPVSQLSWTGSSHSGSVAREVFAISSLPTYRSTITNVSFLRWCFSLLSITYTGCFFTVLP